ncbi:uncharacterized protein FIBRA_01680 [Fibroporia radiculosa]|uniref:SET domain-containing protein n=1 Tax=Fibroporia radiculosa TaxID=599839 RepID=J4GL03_9APHY|nr:uncharacterized protein FIBRA_01680 [Fibroporia radiculosa]CCL99660.1 predicted protein [Fibroporia radiculosa]
MSDLFQWFQSQNGDVDITSLTIADIPGHGRGALALKDLPEGFTLFTIPRELTLSTRTSSLPGRIGKPAWKHFGLDKGWVGLILCIMWEEAQGSSSKWSGYLSSLPSSFDTPMFWNSADLQELQGTAVVDKIGKEQAERDYNGKLLPVVQSRVDLFPPESLSEHYTLHRYHLTGSRILSRSFHVEPWMGGDDDVSDDGSQGPDEAVAKMDVDAERSVVETGTIPGSSETTKELNDELEGPTDDEDDEDEDADDPADVAMVPMADMLNARFGSENAKLFYEEHHLKMVTTKPIKAGEQIWNTYGDPPNSDLLRRYGHVDLVPLEPPLAGLGNPADIVEIGADLAVFAAKKDSPEKLQDKIDWWLEVANDDTFVIGTDCQLPEELVSFARLLFLPRDEWEKVRQKSKLPKPKIDAQVLSVAEDVLSRRINEYSTTIEDDEALLALENAQPLSLNKKHALIVRHGEKRILHGTLQHVNQLQAQAQSSIGGNNKRKNRDGAEVSGTKGKKARS